MKDWNVPLINSLSNISCKSREKRYFKTKKKNLHEISNDNVVTEANFATSGNQIVKSTMFPRCSFHKYTWTSCNGKTHVQIDHVLINGRI